MILVRSPLRCTVCSTLIAAAFAAGCRMSLLDDRAAPPLASAPGREGATAVRTIPVELLFVRHEEHDVTLREQLWQFVDEQALPADLRRRLNANGLRAGVVSGDLPAHVAARLVPAEPATPAAAGEPPACDRRTLRLLPGGRSEILVAASRKDLVLLEHLDGTGRGVTFHDASGLFDLRLRPAADGRVRLEMIPEISHGPRERTWVGEEGTLRMEASQKRHRRDDLGIVLDLAPPELLVVAGTDSQSSTLGDALFRDPSPALTTQRLLVIRPLARGVDPMFAPAVAESGDDQPPIQVR
jgi:hypothetical protein